MLAERNIVNAVKPQRVVVGNHLLRKEPIGMALLASFHNLPDKTLRLVDQQTSIGVEIVKQAVSMFCCSAVDVEICLRLLSAKYPSSYGDLLILTVVEWLS